MKLSKQQICRLFNCTTAQLNAQYAANAKVLDAMRDKATKTGKIVNGYSKEQLVSLTDKYESLSIS